MNEIKDFFNQFTQVEADTATLKRQPELEKYNESIEKLYTFY